MGKNKTSSTQTTTQQLPANQQQNVDLLLNEARRYFQSGGRTFFPGDPIADFDPAQLAGQEQMLNFAGGSGQQLVSDALAGNAFFMDPRNILNPSNIPGFSGVEDAITRGLTRNLTENILPRIRGGGTAVGQFGGTPQTVGEALSTGRTQEAIGDSLSNLYLGAYGQGLQAFNQAMGRAPALFALGAAPGQLTADVGGARQAQQQREIQADVARHEFEQNEPMLLLQLLRDLTGQMGTYGGTTRTESEQVTRNSPITTALGGALSLASLWNPMTSLFGGLAPVVNSGMNTSALLGGQTGANFNPFAGMFGV